jgi:hypothetical protein
MPVLLSLMIARDLRAASRAISMLPSYRTWRGGRRGVPTLRVGPTRRRRPAGPGIASALPSHWSSVTQSHSLRHCRTGSLPALSPSHLVRGPGAAAPGRAFKLPGSGQLELEQGLKPRRTLREAHVLVLGSGTRTLNSAGGSLQVHPPSRRRRRRGRRARPPEALGRAHWHFTPA